MRLGILIIGSLYWDPSRVRCRWRQSRLSCTEERRVMVPIRYGKKSKKRGDTYTMVFARSCSGAATLGTGLVVPARAECCEPEHLFSIMDMNDREVISDCEIETFFGTVTGVEFDNKRRIEVFNLRVSSKKSRRLLLLPFNFPSDIYEGRLEKGELKSLPTLFFKGNRVRVIGRRCGAEGLVVFSDAVYKL